MVVERPIMCDRDLSGDSGCQADLPSDYGTGSTEGEFEHPVIPDVLENQSHEYKGKVNWLYIYIFFYYYYYY